MPNKGKYHCYWGSGTVGYDGKSAIFQESNFDWFSKDRGYTEGSIEEVENLHPGEHADLSQMTQNHVVVCMEAVSSTYALNKKEDSSGE